MSSWFSYDDGRSIGKVNSEGGVILLDEEHSDGARITLKRGPNYISISCNVYGWMDHTCFFDTLQEAQREYVEMKFALGGMMRILSSTNGSNIKAWEAISSFVRQFP